MDQLHPREGLAFCERPYLLFYILEQDSGGTCPTLECTHSPRQDVGKHGRFVKDDLSRTICPDSGFIKQIFSKAEKSSEACNRWDDSSMKSSSDSGSVTGG